MSPLVDPPEAAPPRLRRLRIPRQRSSPATSAPPAGDRHLVSPPSDRELYSYFSTGLPWIQWLLALVYCFVAASMLLFARDTPWMWPVGILVALNVAGLAFSAAVGWRRGNHGVAEHRRRIEQWARVTDDVPEVDVFLPTCGEDLEVLRNAYEHICLVEWPAPVHVHVLDDGHRSEVAALALEYGLDYIARPDRGHLKKSGNLNHALALTDAPFVVVLDADFVARPDFLAHLVPYFDDPTVGIVQAPQYFATTPEMGWLERGSGSGEEFFYRWIQASRSRISSTMCVGTCAVYRRSALEETEGFARISHSEDVHTGHLMARAGYRVEYVAAVLFRGLCTDRLSAYLDQHYRWCMGTLVPSLRGQGPDAPLPRGQLLAMIAGRLYYLQVVVNVLAAQLLLLVMSIGYVDDIRPWHALMFLPGTWLYLVLVPHVSRGRYRLEVLRVQTLAVFAYLLAFVDRAFGRTRAWVATGASGQRGPARSASLLAAAVTGSTLVAGWAVVALAVAERGIADLWTVVAFVVLYSAVFVPLMVALFRELGVVPPGRPRSQPSRAFVPEHGPTSRLTFAAGTLVHLVFAGVAASSNQGWAAAVTAAISR